MSVIICAGIRLDSGCSIVLGAALRTSVAAMSNLRRKRAELLVTLAERRSAGADKAELTGISNRLATADAILRGRAGK